MSWGYWTQMMRRRKWQTGKPEDAKESTYDIQSVLPCADRKSECWLTEFLKKTFLFAVNKADMKSIKHPLWQPTHQVVTLLCSDRRMRSNGSSVEIGMRGLADSTENLGELIVTRIWLGCSQMDDIKSKITDWIMWNTTGPMNKSYSGELDQNYAINSLSLPDTFSFDWSRTG